MNNSTITYEENHDRSLSQCVILTHYILHEIEPLINECMTHYYECVLDHTTTTYTNTISSTQFSENTPIVYTEYAGNMSEYTCCYKYHNFVVRTVKTPEFQGLADSVGCNKSAIFSRDEGSYENDSFSFDNKSSLGVFTLYAMIIPTCPEESEDTLRELNAIHTIPFRQLFTRLRDHESRVQLKFEKQRIPDAI